MKEQVSFKQYRRKQIAELADWVQGMDMTGVSISAADLSNGSPKQGDKIARNPKNHNDKWLVAADYFADNFEALFPQGEGELFSDEELCSYCEEYPCELWEGNGYSTCSKFQDLTELAQAQHALDQQHEANALKEQMERVIKKIYKSYSYLRCLCLAAEDGSEKAKGYDLAMNEALSELVNLKTELEGENG